MVRVTRLGTFDLEMIADGNDSSRLESKQFRSSINTSQIPRSNHPLVTLFTSIIHPFHLCRLPATYFSPRVAQSLTLSKSEDSSH